METTWSARQVRRWLVAAFMLSVSASVSLVAVGDPFDRTAHLALPALLSGSAVALLSTAPHSVGQPLSRQGA